MTASSLRAIRNAAPDIQARHLVEIASVLAGSRDAARVAISIGHSESLRRALASAGLYAGKPEVANVEVRRSGDDRFCVRRKIDATTDVGAVIAVAVARSAKAAADAQRIDDYGDSTESGLALGYPPCCVQSYGRIEHGLDWTEAIRPHPGDAVGPLSWAENCLAGQFDAAAIHPDLFPCRLGCPQAAEFVRAAADAARACGLNAEVEAGVHAMNGRYVLLSGAIVRLERASNRACEVHLRGGTDARWSQVLMGVERFERRGHGIAMYFQSPPLVVPSAGSLVEFNS